MISYEEHKQFLKRQMERAQAEYCGCCAARDEDAETYFFQHESKAAFEKGLAEGNLKLFQDATVTA